MNKLGPRCARPPARRRFRRLPRAARPIFFTLPRTPSHTPWPHQMCTRYRGPPAVAPTIRAGQGPYESSELGYRFLFSFSLSGNTSDFRGSGASPCRMVRVGESRHSCPLPGGPSEGLCLSLPDGAERSLAGRINGPLCVYRFRYGPTPHPRPAFALGSRFRGISFYRLTHSASNRA